MELLEIYVNLEIFEILRVKVYNYDFPSDQEKYSFEKKNSELRKLITVR